ncbi:glycosyltransferase family 39 protein [Christensenellaceae bacterium OttesenSCG-928-K19]|nr:glycosyltransferase family 39 protein [Christensenellaceae bacterium OttesenSCG-928-K19]
MSKTISASNLGEKQNSFFVKNKWGCLLAAFILASVVVKILGCAAQKGPIGFGDELFYKTVAENAFNLQFINEFSHTTNYPPLYSLVLAPAFVFDDPVISYRAMQFINIILSCVAVVGVYKLARLVLEPKWGVLCAVLFMAIPMNWHFPAFIMSENLFFPLFIFALYFLFNNKDVHFWRDNFILAALLAGFILTRHQGWVLLLLFALAWIFKYFVIRRKGIPLKKRIGMLFVMIIVVFSLYLPWLYYGYANGLTFIRTVTGDYSDAIGLMKSARTPASTASWFFGYCSYFVLVLAPWLFFIVCKWKDLFAKGDKKTEDYLFLFSFVIAVALIITATNHTSTLPIWVEGVPMTMKVGRLLGRYILYPIVGFIVVAVHKMASLSKEPARDGSIRSHIWPMVVSLAILLCGYLYIIPKTISGTYTSLIQRINGYDMFPYLDVGIGLLMLGIICCIVSFLLVISKKDRKVFCSGFVLSAIISFYAVMAGSAIQNRLMYVPQERYHQNIVYEIRKALPGKVVGNFVISDEIETGTPNPQASAARIANAFTFFEYQYDSVYRYKDLMDESKYTVEEAYSVLCEQSGYFLTTKPEEGKAESLIYTFRLEDGIYYLYVLPMTG